MTGSPQTDVESRSAALVTVIIVSYNTRQLTLKAIETLLENAGDIAIDVVVFDNASADGSADAIAETFPQVCLIRSEENVGFARANNIVANQARTEWLLLLNPDTETHPGAVEKMVDFARAHPDAGIVGGRTVFPDGTANIASCWNRMTVWSLFCSATGLTRAFRGSRLFNPEGMGNWPRDEARRVDVVVGCLLLIRTKLWRELDGFDLRYVMYGEDYDLSMRAAKAGYSPMITPDAQIMHLVGASSAKREDKLLMVLRSRSTLIRDHFPPSRVLPGLAMMWLWAATRRLGSGLAGRFTGKTELADRWRNIWRARKDWLRGY